MPLSAKALVMIIQQSGQFPVYLNTSHQKSIAGPATNHLQEIGKALERHPTAQTQHWKQERRQERQCFKILRANYFQPRTLKQTRLATSGKGETEILPAHAFSQHAFPLYFLRARECALLILRSSPRKSPVTGENIQK